MSESNRAARAPRGAAKQPATLAQRAILLVVIVTNLATAFLSSSMNLSTPAIGAEFGVGATSLTWVVSAFTLTSAMLCLPAGSLADATGRRRMFLAGLAAFVATTVLGAVAPNMAVLLASRVGQAAGAAMIQSANVPIAISAFPPQRRGWVLGWTVSAVYVGLGLGPVLGGAINQFVGWRAIFVVAAVAAVASLVLATRVVPADEPAAASSPASSPATGAASGAASATSKGRLPAATRAGRLGLTDPLGDALFMAAVFFLVFGLSNLSSMRGAWILLLAGVALAVAFVLQELHAERPVLDVRIFARSRAFTLSNIAALLNYAATFIISYTISLYLQTVMGLSSGAAGLVLVCQPLVQAAISPITGRLSDTVAPRILATLGMGLSAAGLFGLSMLTIDSQLAAVIVPLIIVGFGFGFFSSPNTNAILSCVRPSEFARANSITATMRMLGMSISLAVLTLIFASFLGNTLVAEADPSTLTSAIHTALLLSAGVCAVGTVCSAVR